MKNRYFESVVTIERLYRLFLDVIKNELDKNDIHDINNIQSVIIYHIGKGKVTVGELTNKGYYLGSNVSYNLRKMVNFGYVEQKQSELDKRAVFVQLTAKGAKLHDLLDVILNKHAEKLINIDALAEELKKLEQFWKTELR
jgi:DNA-binding MarR family transcriptional regulator